MLITPPNYWMPNVGIIVGSKYNKNLEILKAAWIEWYVASSSEIETVFRKNNYPWTG